MLRARRRLLLQPALAATALVAAEPDERIAEQERVPQCALALSLGPPDARTTGPQPDPGLQAQAPRRAPSSSAMASDVSALTHISTSQRFDDEVEHISSPLNLPRSRAAVAREMSSSDEAEEDLPHKAPVPAPSISQGKKRALDDDRPKPSVKSPASKAVVASEDDDDDEPPHGSQRTPGSSPKRRRIISEQDDDSGNDSDDLFAMFKKSAAAAKPISPKREKQAMPPSSSSLTSLSPSSSLTPAPSSAARTAKVDARKADAAPVADAGDEGDDLIARLRAKAAEKQAARKERGESANIGNISALPSRQASIFDDPIYEDDGMTNARGTRVRKAATVDAGLKEKKPTLLASRVKASTPANPTMRKQQAATFARLRQMRADRAKGLNSEALDDFSKRFLDCFESGTLDGSADTSAAQSEGDFSHRPSSQPSSDSESEDEDSWDRISSDGESSSTSYDPQDMDAGSEKDETTAFESVADEVQAAQARSSKKKGRQADASSSPSKHSTLDVVSMVKNDMAKEEAEGELSAKQKQMLKFCAFWSKHHVAVPKPVSAKTWVRGLKEGRSTSMIRSMVESEWTDPPRAGCGMLTGCFVCPEPHGAEALFESGLLTAVGAGQLFDKNDQASAQAFVLWIIEQAVFGTSARSAGSELTDLFIQLADLDFDIVDALENAILTTFAKLGAQHSVIKMSISATGAVEQQDVQDKFEVIMAKLDDPNGLEAPAMLRSERILFTDLLLDCVESVER